MARIVVGGLGVWSFWVRRTGRIGRSCRDGRPWLGLWLWGCCWIVGGWQATAAWAQLDLVVKTDGSRITGRMVEMNANELSVERNRVTTKIPVQEIDHVRFSDEPARLNQVRESIQGRQYEQAVRDLSQMSWDGLRPETTLDGMYYMAKARSELALTGAAGHSLGEAVGLLRRFQEGGRNHYQFHRATLLYGRLAMASDRLPLAIETFQGLTSVNDRSIAMQACIELGNAQLLSNRSAEAAAAFRQAGQFDLNDPHSQRLKQTSRIMGLVAEAAPGEAAAVEAIEEIIANESPDDVYVNAFAYNALGRLYLAADRPRDAEIAYLHTDLLFAANAQAHPEALYHLIRIWGEDGKTDRATEAREKLKNRYGGTYWSQKLAN